MNRINKKGFTMIEVLVVVAIIAVLALVVIPGIMKYVQNGKSDYDDSLKKELLVSGKNYYSSNKNLLPKKNYLQQQQVKSSYVTLPEIQSKNYTTKDFIDADGRKCTESYVFVLQDRGTTEYEWHSCLICEGVNHSSDDKYCSISNWEDTTNPSCDSDIVGGKNYGDYVFNPSSVNVNITNNSKISNIRIKNETIDKVLFVEVKNNEEAQKVNLIEKINNKKFFNNKDGIYSIDVISDGGNFSISNCGKKIIIDNTKPTCTLVYNPINSSDKNFKFNVFDNSITKGWVLENSLSSVVDQISSENDIDYSKTSIVKPVLDGNYYGHVKDIAGNENICNANVKIKMFDDEKPYCKFVSGYDGWLGIGKSTNLNLECYAAGGKNAIVNLNAIKSSLELGSVSATNSTTSNNNPDNFVSFVVKYSTITGKQGEDNVVINSGFIATKKGLENETVTSSPLKVDGIKPNITYDPLTSNHSDGWYYAPFKVSMKCTDSYSGVNAFSVNGVSKTNPYTVTRTTAAKPATYASACTDKAGNSISASKSYYVKENSVDSSCGCQTHNSCRTSACGCQTRNRCSACGCESTKTCTGYKYYWGSTSSNKGSSNPGGGISTCKAGNVGSYKRWNITCISCVRGGSAYAPRCNIPGNNRCDLYKWKYKKCNRSSYKYNCGCNYYKRCDSCSCATYNSCANSACGCKVYKTCWHY